MPAKAIRSSSARSPSSIPAKARIATSDLRSTTWEGGDAKSFKFTSENFVDENLVDSVDGHAEHGQRATAVDLAKPERKVLDIDASVVFPTEHMVRVIAAARAGKTILDFPVYDGSETGEKVYDTLTVIGQKLDAKSARHPDAAADETEACRCPALAGHDQLFRKDQKGEKSASRRRIMRSASSFTRTAFARNLSLDYNDFVVVGKLTSLEIKDAKPCP